MLTVCKTFFLKIGNKVLKFFSWNGVQELLNHDVNSLKKEFSQTGKGMQELPFRSGNAVQ